MQQQPSREPVLRVVLPVLFAAILAAVYASGGVDRSALGKDTEIRLEALEKAVRLDAEHRKEIDARLVHTEEALKVVQKRLDVVEPSTAQWVELIPGGTGMFELGDLGRAHAQFLRFDGDAVVFTLESRFGRMERPLLPGRSVVAVDDLGTSRRVLTTTVHRVRHDRGGVAQAALVSMVVTGG